MRAKFGWPWLALSAAMSGSRARQSGRTGEERRQMRRRSPAKGHRTGHYATNGRSGSNWNSHNAQGIGGFRERGRPRHHADKALPKVAPKASHAAIGAIFGGELSRLAPSPAGESCRAGAGAVAAAAPAGCSSAPRGRSAPPASTTWPTHPARGWSGRTTTR